MDSTFSTWLVILLAIAGANLPFFNDKVFALIPLKNGAGGLPRRKPLALRLLELVIWYFIIGALAMMLEARIGGSHKQGGEFYAITGLLFIVFAFPGFVLRYLRKRH